MSEITVSTTIFGTKSAGKTTICKMLGKKGTTSDLTLYNYHKGGITMMIIDPHRYPEKLDSIVEAAQMTDVPVLAVPPEGLDIHGAEVAILLEVLEYPTGIIALTKNDLIGETSELRTSIKKMLKNMKVADYHWMEVSEKVGDTITRLRDAIVERRYNWDEKRNDPLRIEVDHSFPVTGIGTVILGRVKGGTVKKGQSVVVFPGGHKGVVKGIQKQDVDYQSAEAGDRVGIALRGILPKHVGRGSQIVASAESIKESKELKVKIQYAPYAAMLQEGDTLHISIGLQTVPVKVKAIQQNELTLGLEKEVAITPDMKGILMDYNRKMRIVGKVSLKEE